MTHPERTPVPVLPPDKEQRERILAALGAADGDIPKVDESTLCRYYQYLSTHLAFPYPARYPMRSARWKEIAEDFRVLGLFNPAHRLGGEYDGIFCRTQNGNCEVNLPLIELEVSRDHPNFQLLEDYWYWFWNWR